jgi:hypothetical protein
MIGWNLSLVFERSLFRISPGTLGVIAEEVCGFSYTFQTDIMAVAWSDHRFFSSALSLICIYRIIFLFEIIYIYSLTYWRYSIINRKPLMNCNVLTHSWCLVLKLVCNTRNKNAAKFWSILMFILINMDNINTNYLSKEHPCSSGRAYGLHVSIDMHV